MLLLSILCIVLIIIVIALSTKIILLCKAATEICSQFADKLEHDTNTLISISSRDIIMRRLASNINIQLRGLRKEKLHCLQGDMELKSALTNISHDLRTPLTAIYGYLDLLEKADKNETVNRYLKAIRNRTELLKQLTEELFHYSYITSTYDSKSMETVTVNHVLEESIAGFYGSLKEQHITPQIHITDKKIVRTLNRTALSRVFSNLISNAMKYSDGDLQITLNDNGHILFSNASSELDEVQVQRLFDRFYTVASARNSTGLGLSIAKSLLEQMHGTITAEYRNGQLRITISI